MDKKRNFFEKIPFSLPSEGLGEDKYWGVRF
jgi:hypothetical protein